MSTDSQLAAETPRASAVTAVLEHERPEDKELPALSVVVPVRNDPANLERCLAALETSDHPEFEVIVVDDASTDETPAAARRFGVQLLQQKRRTGPAAARNRGAKAARHPFLFFLDADVAVRPDTLSRVAERFVREPEVEAFFGSYDARPSAPNLVSQFRNLVHHYVHQSGNEEASTFWSGCGAMKRSLFLEVGGFDTSYASASIEDIELGSRLRRAGHRIALVKDLQVRHLKRWTLWRMVECDIRKRGIPWTLLILRQRRIPNDLNLRRGQRLSALLAAGLVAAPVLAVWQEGSAAVWALAAAVCLAALISLNLGLYRLLWRRKGPMFTVQAVPLHVLYYLCSGIAFAAGMFVYLSRLRRRLRTDVE